MDIHKTARSNKPHSISNLSLYESHREPSDLVPLSRVAVAGTEGQRSKTGVYKSGSNLMIGWKGLCLTSDHLYVPDLENVEGNH